MSAITYALSSSLSGSSHTRGPAHPTPQNSAAAHAEPKGVREAAEQFERVFLDQMMTTMTAGMESDDGFSIGGDDPYSSMLRDQYADLIAKSGGIGVADAVMRQLLRAQEQN